MGAEEISSKWYWRKEENKTFATHIKGGNEEEEDVEKEEEEGGMERSSEGGGR